MQFVWLVLFWGFVVCLRKSARSARDIWVFLVQLIDYSCVIILPQITQITQRNAAGCIISQRKTVRDGGEVNVVLGFVCDYQRDLRENRPFTHTKTMSMNIKNNNNGRSRVSRGNKIQKQRKFRANEYRVKFT